MSQRTLKVWLEIGSDKIVRVQAGVRVHYVTHELAGAIDVWPIQVSGRAGLLSGREGKGRVLDDYRMLSGFGV